MNIQIHENKDLTNFTTWGAKFTSQYFAELDSVEQLSELRKVSEFTTGRRFILGKGANTLFANDFEGFVLHINLRGVELAEDDGEFESYWVGAGEDWPTIVEYFVMQKNLGGLESLALVPGQVGAAPMQNIACYGATQEDTFVELEAYEIATGELKRFSKDECDFSYRMSRFKSYDKDKYIITRVKYRLKKLGADDKRVEVYESNYESLQYFLNQFGKPPYTAQQIFSAIVELRNYKLPKVSEFGSNGSMFANPIIPRAQAEELLKQFPKMQIYPHTGMTHYANKDVNLEEMELVKIPGGHIFEEIGYRTMDKYGMWNPKMHKSGKVGAWRKHALIATNYGGATSRDIYEFVMQMKQDLFDATGIELPPESNIVVS